MLRILRDMDYGTRRLKAGDLCEPLSREDAALLKQVGFAEDAVEEPVVPAAAPKRRGRPPRHTAAAAPAKPAPEPEEPPLEEKTVPELRELAEEKGVELPSGYVRKDELVELVGAADDDDVV